MKSTIKLVLMGIVILMAGENICIAMHNNALKLPDQSTIQKRLYALELSHFVEKTNIDKNLANAELSPFLLEATINNHIVYYNAYKADGNILNQSETTPNIKNALLREETHDTAPAKYLLPTQSIIKDRLYLLDLKHLVDTTGIDENLANQQVTFFTLNIAIICHISYYNKLRNQGSYPLSISELKPKIREALLKAE